MPRPCAPRECHGPVPWIVTHPTTPPPRAPPRECHGPVPWIVTHPTTPPPRAPPRMPRPCAVDRYAPY